VKITIVGASGFIGRHLSAALTSRGDHVTGVSLRNPDAAAAACAGSDVVVNLAGENVAQRWTPEVKARIRASRVDAPRALIASLGRVEPKPKAYVSASAIGYYGTSESASFEETSGAGGGFLAGVCVEWEAEADRAATHGMRVAKVRTGLVLGTDGGALPKLLPLYRLGAGGIVASGRQWYSWIHVDDQVGVYLHAIDGAEGVLNATAPNPVRNADFNRSLAATLHRPAVFPAPAFAVQLLLGEAASVVTEGQRVLPVRTLATGYTFRYAEIDAAFRSLLGG
jgi:uncharacterized protein (TIGR01777 family)